MADRRRRRRQSDGESDEEPSEAGIVPENKPRISECESESEHRDAGMNPIMPEIKHDLFECEHSARSAPTKRRRLQLTSAAWRKFSGLTQISSLRTVFMSVHKTTIQGS
ncbi:hypothetical protein KUTeg_002272 [Tegillarca granosa]|uniref:Uncharacterized protein n=1 Tax=Tegillarca granosa TaxID=220873 RepID=A0ABQ9FY71_TEGGR|nr:hypothetical protein KUTeg_002272 [Tegillarca granosa]